MTNAAKVRGLRFVSGDSDEKRQEVRLKTFFTGRAFARTATAGAVAAGLMVFSFPGSRALAQNPQSCFVQSKPASASSSGAKGGRTERPRTAVSPRLTWASDSLTWASDSCSFSEENSASDKASDQTIDYYIYPPLPPLTLYQITNTPEVSIVLAGDKNAHINSEGVQGPAFAEYFFIETYAQAVGFGHHSSAITVLAL